MLKKYFTPLNIVFGLEVIVVALASLGLIPREALLFWTGLAVFYMIFSPVKDSLWLTAASIPLFVALPITESFDTLANWRVIIAILFLCLFFKNGISLNLVKDKNGRWRIKENLKHYWVEYFSLAFLILAAVSVFFADYKIMSVKKLLFLVNIFLLFLIARNLIRDKQSILEFLKALAVGGAVVIAGALVQFFSVLFVFTLNAFWGFWVNNVIPVFYGQGLAELLSYSNTWFAYYESAPATLRLFSIFPDSHSFAMTCVLLAPIFMALAFYYAGHKKLRLFYWILAGLAFFGIVFSGSRGAWVSAVPTFIVFAYLYLKKYEIPLAKKIFISFGIFGLIFIAYSAGYPFMLYKFQSWQTGSEISGDINFFERAKSISNADEISNKGRLEIWAATLKSISQKPVFGVGLGNYVNVLDEKASAAKKGASAHNLYLDFAAEIGIPGALFLLAMFGDILYTSWLVFRSRIEPYFKFFALMFGLYFIWILCYSLFDVVLINDKVLLLFMGSAAVLYNLRNIIFNPEKL